MRAVGAVLHAMNADPDGWHYGVDLWHATHLTSGQLYSAFIALEEQGAVEAKWEEPDQPDRLPRRMRRLTELGRGMATMVDPADVQPPAWRVKWRRLLDALDRKVGAL